MSKVLVIPDVHLKPWMFDQAIDIMENTDCELAVCLGDIVDDWGCEHDVDLYEETLKNAIRFASRYPDTLWCLGNHDLAYVWDQYDHPGYSSYAADTVCDMFETLRDTLKRLEEKEAELKSIENNSTNYHNTDNYETFKQALVCQEIMKTVHKLHSNKRNTLKTDMDVTEYKAFALSMPQLNQLSKTVETVFPNLHTSLEAIYPNIDRNEWIHCCLYLLQVDKKCICVLLQEPYYTCRRCTLKLEEIFNCRHGLTAFLIEQAKAF